MEKICRDIELLAPARDLATGIEAIKHGADAVYIGAPKFGARAAAGNSVEDIRQLVDFARPYGVKIYVTLNTIIFDHELEEAQRLVRELEAAGVDALIVQDLALISGELRIPLHASTQMDNRTAEKVAWLRKLGFEQVVLARELTLEEIREIHQQVPDVRLEVFVHGAICVSYNGQCYASQYCFGRSANRGECAQFCRMPFDLIEVRDERLEGSGENVLIRQKHLLSLRDMNRSDNLEELLDAGASSLKIEGRLKDPAYVKNVVASYRQRLDEIFQRRPEYRRSSLGHETITFTPNPTKSFNRLFTDYFLHGRTSDMISIDSPKAIGEYVGRVKEICERMFTVTGTASFTNGDGLCFFNKEHELEGFRVNRTVGNKLYPLQMPRNLKPGTELYRNQDVAFEKQLAGKTAERKIPVSMKFDVIVDDGRGDSCITLSVQAGETRVTVAVPADIQIARKPQREVIRKELQKLGGTPFECKQFDFVDDKEWFVPASKLSELRRQAIEMLLRELQKKPSGQPFLINHDAKFLPAYDKDHLKYPYLYNIANRAARSFYEKQGLTNIASAFECSKDVEHPLLMQCRYCIRYELGMCLKEGKDQKPLILRLGDGRRFRLEFDCRNCQMKVYATSE